MLEKLKKVFQKNQSQSQMNDSPKTKLSKQQIMTIVASVMLVITHVAILLAIFLSFRYYSIYPSLFGSIVAIVICLLIIVDIIFFVGFNHQDLALKIISCSLCVFLLLGGTIGTYFIARANGIVNSVLDGSNSKYETYSGVFVCYDKNNTFSSIVDLSGKKVGLLSETENGISYAAKQTLNEQKIDYGVIEYKSNAELVQALIDGNVDAIGITSAYREIYSIERDENSPFAKYLDNFIDFGSFEKEIKTSSNKKIKNISTEPFNVLLIGYSRTDIGSPIGLADSIIIATINPQTYTVSMMSIARDSFVPISCYGGEYDKINSGRSTSRACFIQTVEDFINTGRSKNDHIDIDYYMELDYLGLVAIVNAIGGILINNPVEFELDGIYVPAGNGVFADGQMALQFCRERHHMPNGDFDRQQHQKEVIIAIAEKFIQSGDVSLALKAMEDASEFMSTDLTLNQLTTLFNLLLNTKNNTGLDTFDLVDFQTLRITGDGGLKYYSYSMHLPLWVYLIYQGSFDESMQHVDDTMGNYKIINQDSSFSFTIREKYVEPELYSLTYPDVFMFTPDPMPAYWADLSGMTLAEAMAWASENNVKITKVNYISASDSGYDASLEGLVCDQSTRYGSLISENSSSEITVMGTGEIDESKIVPNFVEHNYQKAIDWANKYGIPYSVDFDTSADGKVGDVVEQTPKAYTSIDDCEKLKIKVKAGTYTITFDKNGHGGSDVPSNIVVTTGDDPVSFVDMADVLDDPKDHNKYTFLGWFTDKEDGKGTKVSKSSDVSGNTTVYAHWEKLCVHEWDTKATGADENGWVIVTDATCTTDGEKTRKCTKCEKVETEVIEATGHSWEEDAAANGNIAATCETDGVQFYKCSECSETKSEVITALGHDYGDWEITTQPTTTDEGEETRECSRCKKTETRPVPVITNTED